MFEDLKAFLRVLADNLAPRFTAYVLIREGGRHFENVMQGQLFVSREAAERALRGLGMSPGYEVKEVVVWIR